MFEIICSTNRCKVRPKKPTKFCFLRHFMLYSCKNNNNKTLFKLLIHFIISKYAKIIRLNMKQEQIVIISLVNGSIWVLVLNNYFLWTSLNNNFRLFVNTWLDSLLVHNTFLKLNHSNVVGKRSERWKIS